VIDDERSKGDDIKNLRMTTVMCNISGQSRNGREMPLGKYTIWSLTWFSWLYKCAEPEGLKWIASKLPAEYQFQPIYEQYAIKAFENFPLIFIKP